MMDELSWSCEVCGQIRPDEYISVAKHDMGEQNGLTEGIATRNVNYCNDKIECTRVANNYDEFKEYTRNINNALINRTENNKKMHNIKKHAIRGFIYLAFISIIVATIDAILGRQFIDGLFPDSILRWVVRLGFVAYFTWKRPIKLLGKEY